MSERERRGLRAYRAKRDADRTPEPFGADRADRPGLFVVQQHAARRLHYDLRLEWRGVLLSWAVPKGPSLDPDRKSTRLNSSHTVISPLPLHDALPISWCSSTRRAASTTTCAWNGAACCCRGQCRRVPPWT